MKSNKSAAKKKSVSRTQVESKSVDSDRIPEWKHKRAMKTLEKLWKICPQDHGPTDVSERHDFYLTQDESLR
jgi:hypothetical protein